MDKETYVFGAAVVVVLFVIGGLIYTEVNEPCETSVADENQRCSRSGRVFEIREGIPLCVCPKN